MDSSYRVFSNLEKATEMNFCFLCITAILLGENLLLNFYHFSIVDMMRNPELGEKLNLPLSLIFWLGAFSLYTSTLGLIAAIYAREIYYLLPRFSRRAFPKYVITYIHECYGYVKPSKVEKCAHERKDKYLLDCYREYEERAQRESRCVYSAFCCFLMISWNAYLGYRQRNGLSMVILDYFGEKSYILLATLGVVAIPLIHLFFKEDSLRNWIYCPSLYEELTNKNKETPEDYSPPPMRRE